jgi:hypothetical protein
MAWMKRKEEPIVEHTMKIIEEPNKEFVGEDLESIEAQENDIKKRIEKIEAKKLEIKSKIEPTNQISKQEVIDIIEGNITRIAQLVEVLRRL